MRTKIAAILLIGMMILLSGCNRNMSDETEESQNDYEAQQQNADSSGTISENPEQTERNLENTFKVTDGEEGYQDFTLDNILYTENHGEIHFNLYVPDTYDGSIPYALFLTLPGYEGLYFQGVGENLMRENFGFTARAYNSEMIIAAPQLEDWGETSAEQIMELMDYLLTDYNINPEEIYAEGYSAGGVTMSQVISEQPELFTAYLQCSSRWAGSYENVIDAQIPIYFVIGENDEYYGSGPSIEAYETLYNMYREMGLSENEIDEILVLDVKDASYFESRGMAEQHGGGLLFADDQQIMGWLFDN